MAFVKQQGEIAALNRAQEKAEARVSSIHHQLTTSESELSVLEGEMAEVCTMQPTIACLDFPCKDGCSCCIFYVDDNAVP